MQNSTALKWNADYRLILVFTAFAAVGLFLIVSAIRYRIGFPLDDSWIHLVYARNLAEHGQWAFRLGEQSAGSTSPLWTALLAIGFLFRLGPYVWTYILGGIVLSAMAILAESVARRLVKTYQSRVPWVGLFITLEWHMTWSATSGMETLLHGLIAMAVLAALMENSRRYLTLGLLAGLSIWVRPDGLTLLGPILFTMFFQEDSFNARGKALVKVAIGFGVLFIPYLVFNLALSGTPMPNTFYAKQAEYEVYWRSKPFMERVADYVSPIVAGPFVILLPGMFLWVYKAIRERQWGSIAGLIWVLGYIGIYFTRLPAYHHGRYIIPTLPILYLWGLLGMLGFVTLASSNRRVAFLWQVVTIVLSLSFQITGAIKNSYEVIWIETQMVRTANWVNENLPEDTVLVVHDIGAIGYFSKNPLIDLAGLITPEVVLFIRDEAQIATYIDSSPAEYLISFPGWYPQLTSQHRAIFESGIEAYPFDENMTVYSWR